MRETQRPRTSPEIGKPIRRNILPHRQVMDGGLQVLAERQNIAASLPQIVERREQLGFGLTQPQHETGLGVHAAAGSRLDFAQHAQGPLVGSP